MSKRENKELAIKLLGSTQMSYQQISKETGVSRSTVAYMAKKYRPEHLLNSIGRKPKGELGVPNIQIDLSEEPQSVIVPHPDSIPVRRSSNEGVIVSFNLSVEEQAVPKETAVNRLEGVLQVLKTLPGDQVSLSMKLEQ
ncbi:DNA binding protein [Bacillus phage Grass]|uniref:DNA binding protein n=1 Tax=Bacillus phage Grass TaxID=1406785 RepID=U5PXX1_BPGRA|nr:sigma factor [Bacillus phage Grass]AGY47432.1 DNA binding protein [Bacillus phage Grass]